MPLKSSFHTSIELMTGNFEDPSNQSGYGLFMGIPAARKRAAELNCKEDYSETSGQEARWLGSLVGNSRSSRESTTATCQLRELGEDVEQLNGCTREGKRRSCRGLVAAEEGGVRKKGKGGVHSNLLSQSRMSRRCRAVTSGPSEIFLSYS
ncbi:hypothetical protein CRG98_012343 [Punica granatum]|uniref:Uncharacterized protein n=1 Tax=Punica granatum TaxID=22663 RepID=A0A2I0KFI3_PUNGR|nr:hypothetical protein CRG98_012343 [Punica granatum]